MIRILCVLVILAGCSRGPVWTKPGGTADELAVDRYACRQENRVYSYAPENASPLVAGMLEGQRIDPTGYELCLAARGWREE